MLERIVSVVSQVVGEVWVVARESQTVAEELLRQRRLRPLFLVEAFDARIVCAAELREVDAELETLRSAGCEAGGL